jgi:hypothetical protein
MKTLTLLPKTKNLFITFIIIGIAAFGISLFLNPARAWHGYVLNYYYFMALGIGGVFFTGTQHLTNAGWSATVRRIPEALSAWFFPAVILFVPIIFGGKYVYLWMNNKAVAADPLLQLKTPYLNVPFFIIRAVLFFALWYFVGNQFVRNSLKQDDVGGTELTKKNVKLSAIFMPLFAILFSIVSFDLIMSLDPHWFSTMFGVNCFANLFLSTIAVVIVIVIHLKKSGYFGDTVNENHIQNLGLLLFAFLVFYAYIAFCQFMLIWYGNLPEETSYYLRRWENGWSVYAMYILFCKFMLPFLLLLPRDAKRNMNYLICMAYFIIFSNWVDTFWMVMPSYSKNVVAPVLEFAMFFGFVGAFGLTVCNFLAKNPIQPQKDPRIQEALHLHQ